MIIDGKKGQVTVFIIIAVVIVVGIVAYFAVRGGIGGSSVPREMQPVYDYYLSCLQEQAREGTSLLGEQGGYIEVPDFVPGSNYRPYSSQLDFFGQPVAYWMYVSGNNLLKEQVPSKNDMEGQLEEYVADRVSYCDFSDFYEQGYDVYVDTDDVKVNVEIEDNKVDVSVDNDLVIVYGEDSVIVQGHEVDVDSKLGKFYDLAIEVYNYEKKEMFLELYALDVMRLYAPVTGVELSCAPKVFVEEEIREELVNGLAANVGALKLDGDYYSLSEGENDYFVTDAGIGVDENVNFVYSIDWPTRVEIYGDLVAEPVGLQDGLSVLGFCYVPYHFVYDIDFPVLIQFYDEQEIFQFPVSVVIDKSQAREALPSVAGEYIEAEVCKYPNKEVLVETYDTSLNPVSARIQFKCLDSLCEIGETDSSGSLYVDMPRCINGFIVANAEGYQETKYQISTNEETSASVIMNKLYSVGLDLGSVDSAMVSFVSDDYSTSAYYPEMDSVELVEGYYNVTVYAYSGSSLIIPETHERKCVEVPEDGIEGLFGAVKERCFNIDLPSTEVEMAVVGGGKTREYITEGQLEGARELNVNVPLFGVPGSLDELQDNYIKVEDSIVYLSFE